MRRVRRSARAVLFVGVPLAILAVLALKADWRSVPSGWPLAAAALLSLAAVILRPLLWVILVWSMSGEARGSGDLAQLVRGANRARVTRYIPGRIAFWGTRYAVGAKAGYPKTAVAAGIALDNVLTLGVLGALGASALLWACCSPALGLAGLLALLALLGLALSRGSSATGRSLAALSRLLPRRLRGRVESISSAASLTVAGSHAASLVAAYSLWVALRTAMFVVIALAASDLDAGDVAYLVAVSSAAALVGQLAFFTPMGLGAREGAVVSLLAGSVPVAAASTIATSTRVLQLAAEVPGMLAIELALWVWSRAAVRAQSVARGREPWAVERSRNAEP